ncbi:MAG: GMC family oxidoreductase N-terminal domain-containing protein [Reyranellaceae bacterium]
MPTADPAAYDFIIVGAGSAGAALAYRLSENPRHRVLLLEAGAADNPWTRLPVAYARLINNPAANWLYSSEPEPSTSGRRIPVPRGKLLGGSSAINGLAFVRGQAQDFDTWAQLGNTGWSYDDVLPLFRRMESWQGPPDDRYRGRNGPLRVTDPPPAGPFFQAIIAAAAEVGIRYNPDYNGARQDGIVMSQATIADGWRMSTARCYLDPARRRANLRIVTDAHTESVLLEGTRCVGVRWSTPDGGRHEARAGRDVILSAGSINSPQLLELSGIGQPERLQALGIAVRHPLPGVGENLRDHYAPRTRWEVGTRGITYNDTARGLGLARQALRWLVRRDGLLAMVGAPMRAFVFSRDGLAAPDLLLGWVPMFTEPGPKGPRIARQAGFTCYAHPMRPESRGSVHLASADPRTPPAIRFNFLSAAVDGELTVRAIRIARSIMTAPALASFRLTEQAPGTQRQSDGDILDWVKATAETTYHPVGTCKMGIDPMAVVDPRLRVHGLMGLRVADASIMPTLTSGNTNAPAIMIGEKAADLVLQDA